MRATDFDNDGDLDLFVGGRGVPGKYPMPDRSYILINDGGVFTDQTRAWSPELEYPGMVTDALVTDLNGDDLPDLVITGEWMSIWFYLNTGNGFVHHPPGFDEFYLPGWYYSLKEVDYNGDGKMDIVAGNMGNNHKFHPTKDEPFHVFLDDFDENGTFDIVIKNVSFYEEK